MDGRNRFLEIGFNAGHSALLYMFVNPQGTYHGVDLASREYTEAAAAFFERRFPGRFKLERGDSTVILPRMITRGEEPFDAIHVDGGHTFQVALADIACSLRLLRDDGLLLVDDSPAEGVRAAIAVAIGAWYRPDPLWAEYIDSYQTYLQKA